MTETLAIISLPFGAGSWARGDDREKTIARAARICRSDWNKLYPKAFGKGKIVKINVVTLPEGTQKVTWDERGIYLDDFTPPKKFDGKVDLVEYTYGAK